MTEKETKKLHELFERAVRERAEQIGEESEAMNDVLDDLARAYEVKDDDR